jgi:hypothetical protein
MADHDGKRGQSPQNLNRMQLAWRHLRWLLQQDYADIDAKQLSFIFLQ